MLKFGSSSEFPASILHLLATDDFLGIFFKRLFVTSAMCLSVCYTKFNLKSKIKTLSFCLPYLFIFVIGSLLVLVLHY